MTSLTRRYGSWIYVLIAAVCWALIGCATALGPGYTVETQNIRVDFLPQPQPSIAITAEYQLANTGNRPLNSLEMRLPSRRFRAQDLQITWDGGTLAAASASENARDTIVRFPQEWKIGEKHTLKFSYAIPSAPARDDMLGFSVDAFYLPSEGWTPNLPQASGLFGFGGVPPKQWQLTIRVPTQFLVRASGKEKRSGGHKTGEYVFTQTARDLQPFVIAGRYRESRQELKQGQKVIIWTREQLEPARVLQSGESLSRTLASYETLFGTRQASRSALWLVECPAAIGCIVHRETGYSVLLYGQETARSAEMISADTVLVDPRAAGASLEAVAAPALAEGWLGYGQSPGFYEQQPPMSALPAFATALAREASSGPNVRAEIVRRALGAIPDPPAAGSNGDANVTRAKSLLLFYALQQRVGAEAFQRALQHMLYARRSRGFDVTDLISALEEESHQSVGPFVRHWIKSPGVPEEFRRTFSASAAQQEFSSQETTR